MSVPFPQAIGNSYENFKPSGDTHRGYSANRPGEGSVWTTDESHATKAEPHRITTGWKIRNLSVFPLVCIVLSNTEDGPPDIQLDASLDGRYGAHHDLAMAA